VLELWLSDRTVSIGHRTFGRVRVTNRGRRTVYRQTGGNCGVTAHILVDQRAMIPPGRMWDGVAATFTRRVRADWKPGMYGFRPVDFIDLGEYGCPDHFSLDPVRPGQVVDVKFAWDPASRFGSPLMPGRAEVTASFPFFRDREQYGRADERRVTATTTVRIKGQAHPQRWLTEYLDLALSEPHFADWLDDYPPRTWINTHVVLWPNEDGIYPRDAIFQQATEGALEVGLFRRGVNPTEYLAVVLDVPSGAALGVLTR
jgi:hypothetical protein